MALRVWLPLNGSLENKGISDYEIRSANIIIADDGKIGKCYSFNGSNSYINITNFEIGNNWSYGCWVNTPNSDSRNWEIVMILNNSGSDADSQFAFWIHQKENRFESLANTQYVSTIPYTNYYNGWHHFFATFNGTLLTTYIDGNVVNTKTITATQYNAINLTIGARSTNATGTAFTSWFQGKLNDIRVYDNCLSPLEVKEISQGLVLHYKLDGFNGGVGENLLSKYVSPGQSTPKSTATAGRTNYYGDYGIIIPATENADTYFRLWLDQPLETNEIYTISCNVSGLLPGTYYNFPLFAQSNTAMGVLQLNKNGICSLTFTMTYSTQNSTTVDGRTVYVCFMDDSGRTIASGQGPITVTNFKIEKGTNATSFCKSLTDLGINSSIIKDSSGYENDGEIYKYDSTGSIETIISDENRYNISTFINSENNTTNTAAGTCYIYGHCNLVNPIEISVAFWCKPIAGYNGGTTQGQFCLTNQTSISNCGTDYTTGTMNHYDSGIRLNGSTSSIYIKPSVTFTANSWHHYVITYDGQNGKIYKDGNLISTTAMSSATSLGSCVGAIIGFSKAGGVWRSNKSYYSDFRIYITALSAEDILDLYHTPANIDNLGNIHGFEINEVNTPYSINQIGQINMGNFFENGYQKYLKYDNNIYVEPDGSQWIHVFHHNDPTTSGYFVRNSDWEHGVYIDENKWYNIEEIVYTLPKYEFMVKQKTTSSAAEAKYRWIQDINPLEATYNDVKPGTVIFNTSSGYTNSSYGGLWKMNSSARMCIANATSSNWFGALGSWSAYNTNQVPGFPNTSISTGYIDLYMRIYPPAKIVKDLGMSGNTFIEK